MDPGRDRLRAVDRRHHRPDRADAGRRHRRCRPLRAAGRGPRGRDHRLSCALGYAIWPIFPVVVAAATLHATASCVLGPAIAAISLGLVGPRAIGERLGRNARFASLGNGSAAALMGACGYFLSSRSVFVVTAAAGDPDHAGAGADPRSAKSTSRRRMARSRARSPTSEATSVCSLLRQRPLLIFAGSVLLLQLANAAMLPLMARRGHHPLEPVGAGADRRLHHRAAGDRGAGLTMGRPHGAAMGAAAVAAARDLARWRFAACCLPS